MAIQLVTCPHCQGQTKVDSSRGQAGFRCPHCQGILSLGPSKSATPAILDSELPTQASELQCPLCAGRFQLPPDFSGDFVKCPHCLETIRIPRQNTGPVHAHQSEEMFVVSVGDQQVTLRDKAKTIEYRGANIRLRELSRKEKSSRRRLRNLVVGVGCIVVLIVTAVILINVG